MVNSYLGTLKKYAVFAGRASRKEYWTFYLISLLILAVLGVLDQHVIGAKGALSVIFFLIIILPLIAVTVRRLHDTNRSGWWYFIAFIPVIGTIILIVFLLLSSQPGENRYGPHPYAKDMGVSVAAEESVSP